MSVDRPASSVVDVHTHAVVPEAFEIVANENGFRLEREADLANFGSETMKHQLAMLEEIEAPLTDPERRLEAMDRQGVDIQLVSPSPAHYHTWAEPELARLIARTVNEGIARFCNSHPDRFVGLGFAPIQHPDVAEEAMAHAVVELGLKGVEITTSAPGRELGDEAYRGFWARAEELGALVFIHPWGCTLGERLNRHYLANIVGNPVETTVALSHLIFSGLLDYHPDLRILAAHGGGYLPFYTGRSDHGWKVRQEIRTPRELPSSYLRRLYFDSLVYEPEALAYLVSRVGAERVLLGSDFPFDMGVEDPVGHVHASPGLDAAGRDAICGANATRLLGLGERSVQRPEDRRTTGVKLSPGKGVGT
ncbi:amidohydrolase family protein [Rubrobacter calidifluminis]|uniref:amidohydrolase family protein n=1 Tax=Rubrobacter calidifluminis TaxID=1392640 RepID=UPI00236226D5|nr:amidohydrolase family protein [Rubrobacter calidifluminis]